jgi:hypothetical protein
VSNPRNGVRLRVNSRTSIVKGAAIAMTEHTIVVISEAHAASHMPAMPDVGAWSASAAATVDDVADIELMAAVNVPEPLETT